ncbi:MAG: N-acetyltransferase [Oscillospiraceae bacterium]
MPYNEPQKAIELEFRNIDNTDNLLDVARLIFQTDHYVYPALFGSIKNAENLLPGVIKQDAVCFCSDNLFGAFYDKHVVGIVCYFNGDYRWSSDVIINEFKKNRIEIPRSFYRASTEYFEGLAHSDDLKRGTYIMNVCIIDSLRNIGLGTRLLRSFFETKGVESCSLEVLAENATAINLYQKFGFAVQQERVGFSVNPPYPRCFYMIRNGS